MIGLIFLGSVSGEEISKKKKFFQTFYIFVKDDSSLMNFPIKLMNIFVEFVFFFEKKNHFRFNSSNIRTFN